MSDWKECLLQDLVVFQRGHDLPKTEMKNGTIPVAGSNGIIGYHNIATTKGPGITIGRSGNIGTPHFYKNDYWAHNTVLYAIDFNGNDEKYVFYFLNTIDFKGFNAGSAVPTLNRNHIHELIINKPPLPEQKAIADVLSSLDDKIDLLHRQNMTLEEMAEALFRQWFVEEASDDWEERQLGEVISISIGRTPPRQEFHWFSENQNDIKWVSIKDLATSGIFVFDTAEKLTREAVKSFNIPIIPNDTVILSFKMTVGRVGITTENMLSNEAIAHLIINSNTPFIKEYLYFFLKTYNYDSLGSTSSIVTAINSSMIKELIIKIPSVQIMNQFKEIVEKQFNQIKVNQVQINTLIKLRNTLLPKLMSGEVRVAV